MNNLQQNTVDELLHARLDWEVNMNQHRSDALAATNAGDDDRAHAFTTRAAELRDRVMAIDNELNARARKLERNALAMDAEAKTLEEQARYAESDAARDEARHCRTEAAHLLARV